VLMQSMAGSGHRFAVKRLRLADKLEIFRFDPWGMFSQLLFLFFCICDTDIVLVELMVHCACYHIS